MKPYFYIKHITVLLTKQLNPIDDKNHKDQNRYILIVSRQINNVTSSGFIILKLISKLFTKRQNTIHTQRIATIPRK